MSKGQVDLTFQLLVRILTCLFLSGCLVGIATYCYGLVRASVVPPCNAQTQNMSKLQDHFVHREYLQIVIDLTPYYWEKHNEFTIIFLVPSWELTIISFGKLIIPLAEQILSSLKTQIVALCSPKFLCRVGMMPATHFVIFLSITCIWPSKPHPPCRINLAKVWVWALTRAWALTRQVSNGSLHNNRWFGSEQINKLHSNLKQSKAFDESCSKEAVYQKILAKWYSKSYPSGPSGK